MSKDLGDSGVRGLVDPAAPGRAVELDNIFRAMLGITAGHHAIHEEIAFYAWAKAADDFSLAFKVPAGLKLPHVIVGLDAESAALLELYEGRTWSATTGTVHPIRNRFRPSLNASILEEDKTGSWVAGNMLLNPTGQSGGTVIDEIETWSGKQQTFQSRAIAELVYKPDTTYVVAVTQPLANNAKIIIGWYEKVPE